MHAWVNIGHVHKNISVTGTTYRKPHCLSRMVFSAMMSRDIERWNHDKDAFEA